MVATAAWHSVARREQASRSQQYGRTSSARTDKSPVELDMLVTTNLDSSKCEGATLDHVLKIFKAAIKLLEKGDEVDLMSISKECGGMAPYIAELVSDSVSQYFKVPFIVRELLDHSKRKMLTQLVIDVNDDLVSAKPIDAIIGRINHVYSAVNNLDPEGDEEDFSGQAELFLEEIIKRCETDGITGITTGFKSFTRDLVFLLLLKPTLTFLNRPALFNLILLSLPLGFLYVCFFFLLTPSFEYL